MGALSNVWGRIRSVFNRERAEIEKAIELQHGEAYPMGFDAYSIYSRYGMEPLMDYLRIEQELNTRYLDYAEMCSYPELASAIDVYADESTQPDVLTGRTIWVESDDGQIKKLLQDLIDTNLELDEDIWSIARMTCLYGNHYEEHLVTQEGLVGVNALPPETVRRFEKGKGILVGYAQDPRGIFGITVDDVDNVLKGRANPPSGMQVFEPWQITHFRLLSRTRPSVYGVGVLEAARWVWRRLLLLEDAVLIHRLTRLPARWMFYIDCGKLPPTQALAHIRRIKNEFGKRKFLNERGSLDLRYNVLASDENLFLPVIDGRRTTEVEVMATPEWQSLDDANYFLNKLFSAIKIPKAYLNYEEAARSRLLALEDVRFARTIMRIQRELRNGVRKMCKVHLAALGIDPEKVSFDVFMTVPSWAYELAQIEVRNAKAEFADRVRPYLSERAVMKTIFGFSDEEIDAIRKEREEEARGTVDVGPIEPPQPRPRRRTEGSSPMDLPGASLMGKDEERQIEQLQESMDKVLKTNTVMADRLREVQEFAKLFKSATMFKAGSGRTKVVNSLGIGGFPQALKR